MFPKSVGSIPDVRSEKITWKTFGKGRGKKNFEGDWMKPLLVTFKANQSDSFTSTASW